jgi:hypothetical protein
MPMKHSSDTVWNRNRNLPACSAQYWQISTNNVPVEVYEKRFYLWDGNIWKRSAVNSKFMEQSACLESSNSSHIQGLSRILWNLKVFQSVHTNSPLFPVLSQINPVRDLAALQPVWTLTKRRNSFHCQESNHDSSWRGHFTANQLKTWHLKSLTPVQGD